ncbi:biopolymer transporter ExbD [Gemmata sp. JC717]|uniref:ExbD/TolR family protein n=1 Tax=Gemmata algarum TaxID=2975278 RepID=UPI0021BA4CDD|nr:biopolymer transporter ExbD [Gemmata algarum]MDY3551123.1 biopolymer transporter ExbD [Gemmata algarum]
MSQWQVRKEGAVEVLALPNAAEVLAGLRDGNFLPTDEVKGPTDGDWQPIEAHPAFAEAAADVEPLPPEEVDDTHLDMNPLIDVCLVLLIFFILTITYASVERAIEVPEDTPEGKGTPRVEYKDIKDRVFKVVVRMDGERPVIKIEDKEVAKEQIFKEMESVINSTGRKEMVLDRDKSVPWGVITAILDAAKGNQVHRIVYNQRKRD